MPYQSHCALYLLMPCFSTHVWKGYDSLLLLPKCQLHSSLPVGGKDRQWQMKTSHRLDPFSPSCPGMCRWTGPHPCTSLAWPRRSRSEHFQKKKKKGSLLLLPPSWLDSVLHNPASPKTAGSELLLEWENHELVLAPSTKWPHSNCVGGGGKGYPFKEWQERQFWGGGKISWLTLPSQRASLARNGPEVWDIVLGSQASLLRSTS